MQYRDEHGYSPSLREVASILGYKSPGTVQYHVETLIRRGLLKREPALARALAPRLELREQLLVRLPETSTNGGLSFIPILNANLYRGEPATRIEYLEVPSALLRQGRYVAVQIVGDGPVGTAVLDGDWVACDLISEVAPGSIVLKVDDQLRATVEVAATYQDAWVRQSLAGPIAAILRRV